MSKKNFNAIPSAACRLAGGEVSVGDNGENSKTAPVRLKARSGQPIEHWFWGKVVHDMAGMQRHKARLTIDYAHNDSEVLGYLNHFDTSDGNLIASGALTPFQENDRASEVLYKMKQGVPYEASIFFGGEGIEIEEVGEGECPMVNGMAFAGPGVIIRKWPLRGVAICPYGADANTESAAMGAGETFSAVQVKKEQETKMEAKAVEPVEAKAVVEAQAVETVAVEAKELKASDPVATVASPSVPEVAVAPVVAPEQLKQVDADHAAQVTSLTSERDALKADFDKIAGQLSEVSAELKKVAGEKADLEAKYTALTGGVKPVSAAPAPEVKPLSAWQQAQKKK